MLATLAPLTEELRTIEALRILGLTEYEARTYLALVRNGPSIARDVSFLGRVPRTKTYGALRNLERKKLVRAIPGTPETYAAASPFEILMPLAQRISADATQALAAIQELTEQREIRHSTREIPQELNELWILEGKRPAVTVRILELIKRAAKSVDCYSTAAGTVRVYKAYADALADAKNRGVAVHMLARGSRENASVIRELHQIIEVKEVSAGTDKNFFVFDRQIAAVVESQPDDYEAVEGMARMTWTSNAELAELSALLFTRLWDATKNDHPKDGAI